MAKISQKISQAALYFLLLVGPILGLATKGFAPLMAIAGSMALIAVLMRPEKLKQIELSKFKFAFPFLFFMGLSLLWSKAENGSSSYLVLLLLVAFIECLRIAYESLPLDEQDKFKHLLNISIFGIVVSLLLARILTFGLNYQLSQKNFPNNLSY